MGDVTQVRINELARELEVKARIILEYLPQVGVTEKKTHSSSIDINHAELVRAHFLQAGGGEATAEVPAPEPPPVQAPPVAPRIVPPHVAAPPVVAKPVAPVAAPSAPPIAHPPAPVTLPGDAARATPISASAATPPRTAPSARPHAATGATPPSLGAPLIRRPAPSASGAKSAPSPRSLGPMPKLPTMGMPTLKPDSPRPSKPSRPLSPRTGGSGARQPTHPTSASPGGAPRPGSTPLSSRPGFAPVSRPSSRPGSSTAGQRPSSRPPIRAGQPFPSLSGGNAPAPPKAEPGKPLYQRKPAARNRPTLEKRFAEGERKLHPVRTRAGATDRHTTHAEIVQAPVREPRKVTITEGVTVRDLAEKLDVRAKELLKTLLDRGIFASINQALDVNTATTLAEAFSGIVEVISIEETLAHEEMTPAEQEEKKSPRAPVVTVMGHVDHGKTSLLDTIRETEVAAGEAGGITQHIGAYQVQVHGRPVVFIDTPGHEAFTRMRARGAKVTDIVVLVVAADDGLMPQTEEAIDHARAAGVPIIVAINKIDKPDAQPERVKRQLADHKLMPEEWGGDTVMVEVSAKSKTNIDRLLEMILLVGDLRDLKANPEAMASGTVLESRVDKGRGPVATVLVQNGTLHVGDSFLCGAVYGKVRAMFDDRGNAAKEAGPSTPVEVLGLQGVPDAGDQFQVADEAKARHIVEYRQGKQREAALAKSSTSRLTLDQLHEQLMLGEVKDLPILIKADVQGSVEVLGEMLSKLSNDKVKIKSIHASVGAVSETDVLLASASNAVIIAFNVRPERKAADLAQQEGVDIRLHTIIYEVVDEIKKAMTGMLAPVFKEIFLGRAEIREVFRIKGVGTIAGCRVVDGLIKRDAEVRVLRDSVVVYTGRISSLRRFKEDAGEVRNGFECGIGVSNFNDVKTGDILECFATERVAPGPSAS